MLVVPFVLVVVATLTSLSTLQLTYAFYHSHQQQQSKDSVSRLMASPRYDDTWLELTNKLSSKTNLLNNDGTPSDVMTSSSSSAATDVDFSSIKDLPFHQVPSVMADSFESLLSQLKTVSEQITTKADTTVIINSSPPEFVQQTIHTVTQTIQQLQHTLNTNHNDPTIATQISNFIDIMTPQNTPTVIVLSAGISFILISNIIQSLDRRNISLPLPSTTTTTTPYPNGIYDPYTAQLYFDRRLVQVSKRFVEITIQCIKFASHLYQDRTSGKWYTNMNKRGIELAELLTELGPTFIKVGQSLSIRTDLLPPAYVRGLATLQDRVPPFDSRLALSILEQEWDVNNVYDILQDLSAEPVAAASLGQVYKATLKEEYGGTNVAIKVQRPNIETQIALDMYLLREVAPIVKRVFGLNTDTVGTVDAWGKGFVDELNYIAEAENGQYFLEQIQQTPLRDVVLAPDIIEEYTTSKVLVTEWIDGERLDKSNQQDVTILCSICMNTYLTMLLEMGLLHCDPHPGNLLRTPDGKLCILDWGMVTSIPPQLQLTLIEHMAHLTSRDYAEVPRDLYLLGFVPEDRADDVVNSGVVEVLAGVYGQWTDGGGLATINANEVLNRLQELASEKGNLFQIPPYFAYIAKSFSVLEGIGLSNDPTFRLLTDKDNMRNALNTFVFGPEKNNIATRLVNTKRVKQLVTGFSNFTSSSASGVLLSNKNDGTLDSAGGLVTAAASTVTTTEMLDKVADQVLDIVLTEEETPLQQILTEQLAKIVASNTRMLWTEARLRSGVLPSGRTVLGTLVDPLGVFQTSPLVNANDQDERVVEMTLELVDIFRNLQQQQQKEHSTPGKDKRNLALLDLQSLGRQELIAFSRILSQKIWNRRSSLIKSSNRFLRTILDLTATRLETTERIPVGQRRPSIGVINTASTATSTNGESKGTAGMTSSGIITPKTTIDRDHASSIPADTAAAAANTKPEKRETTSSSRLIAARERLDSLST